MRILIEALGIHTYGGGRSAVLNLLEALLEIDRTNEYEILLTAYEPTLAHRSAAARQVICPFKNRFLVRLWAQYAIAKRAETTNLIHFTKNLGVFGTRIPHIVTIHDLTILRYPELFPRIDVWYWRTIEPRTVLGADRVIAVSRATARDLEIFYGLPREKIQVIHHGCAPHFKPAPREEIDRVMDKYKLPEKYILNVGHIDRKKNLPMLIEAFALFTRWTGFDGQLIFVGQEYKRTREVSLQEAVGQFQLEGKVRFTGPVPDQDLPGLYSGAFIAVYPSLHEGFGLVALEAMACGAPLVASAAGALEEVVGEAAMLVHSNDAHSFAMALAEVERSPTLRAEMIMKELKRAAEFDRQKVAEATLSLYMDLAG
jgi:glycosyltransferase involved in cell wall biosynthesis